LQIDGLRRLPCPAQSDFPRRITGVEPKLVGRSKTWLEADVARRQSIQTARVADGLPFLA
jgi:hypothetical protein